MLKILYVEEDKELNSITASYLKNSNFETI